MTKKLLDKVVALLDPSDAEYMIAQDIIITILDEVKEAVDNDMIATVEDALEAIDNLRGSNSPQLPDTPYEQKVTCSKCGMDFSGTTGYVCSNADCPMGLNGSTC